MALMTAKEYIDSLRKLNTRVYMFGEKIDNWVDHPMIRPSINCVAMTYALAQDPRYEELMTATSSLTGRRINRFTHLHQSADDLVKKVKMQRLLGQKTASCFQRCVGMDAFNAVYSTTYEIDEKCGTSYHENFKKFLVYVQDNDLTVDGAKRLPLKAHASHEPVIPEEAQRVIMVIGIDGVGKTIRETCHRSALYAQLAGVDEETVVTPQLAARVINAEGYGDRVYINKVESAADYEAAQAMANEFSCPVIAGSLHQGVYVCLH